MIQNPIPFPYHPPSPQVHGHPLTPSEGSSPTKRANGSNATGTTSSQPLQNVVHGHPFSPSNGAHGHPFSSPTSSSPFVGIGGSYFRPLTLKSNTTIGSTTHGHPYSPSSQSNVIHGHPYSPSSSSTSIHGHPYSPSSSSYNEEINCAISWWKKQIVENGPSISIAMVNIFEQKLLEFLVQKIEKHWFVDNPARGQAYRSISLDTLGKPDPLLQAASKAANINLFECFPYAESVTMWIDPGLVAVKIYWTYAKTASEEVIYANNNDKKKLFIPKLSSVLPKQTTSKRIDSQGNTTITAMPSGILHIPNNPIQQEERLPQSDDELLKDWWDSVSENVLSIRA